MSTAKDGWAEVVTPSTGESPNDANAALSIMGSDITFRLLAEAAGEAGHGIVIVQDLGDRAGVIVYVSRVGADALGYSKDELLGRPVFDFLHPDCMPAAVERYRRRQRGEAVPRISELKVLKRDGTICTVETSAVTTTIEGKKTTLVFVSDVTGRRLTEARFCESEEKYRQLVENINAVVYSVDQKGITTYVSPTFESLFGVSPSEVVGRPFADFIHPEDLHASTKKSLEAMAGILNEPWECRIVAPGSGTTFWVQGHNRPVYKDGVIVGFQGVEVDITGQKRAEEALQVSEKKYRTLVEFSPDGILSADPQGRVLDCNTGICKLIGLGMDDLRGADLREVIAGEAVTGQPSFWRQIDQCGYAEAEMEMLHRNGHKIPVWAKVVKVKGTKQEDFQILVYVRDMEERKKVEALKDQFISLVSHELRTPLTVIMGAVNTALSEGQRLSPDETRRLLEDAASEADSLSAILENLLELSRSKADRMVLELEPVFIQEVVQKTISEAKRCFPLRQFAIDLPRRLPAVRADRLRVQRILHNLVGNAVKYSPDGEVLVSARREGGSLVIAVHDQGPGISREDQARLFQPFERVRGADTNHVKGIGLGLLVCRSLVEAHGGRIWLDSEPGQGTTVFFSLPIEPGRRE